MPFDSEKQRRYLWANKPEVAKKIAHAQSGGGVYSSGVYDDSAKWWNQKMAGIPQHVGFIDDPDNITETPLTNPDDPYGGRFINPDRAQPKGGYTDLATYYTAKQRAMGRGEKELARMKIENERIKREALKRGFINPDGSTNFQEGGEVPMADNRKPKKVTKKDRYGNQVSVEYESDKKPLDITTLFEKMLDMQIPESFEIPESAPVGGGVTIVPPWGHPGEPKGSDTVPAWLTPGEFVVNAEAMSVPENAAAVEAINDQGRQMQQGGMMYQEGGSVPVPISPTEALLREREGYRPEVYLDTRDRPTVGHGHLLPDEYIAREGERPFSEKQLDDFFQEDMATARAAAKNNAKKYGVKWDDLSRREKVALTSMAFQLGETGQGEFEEMWKAFARGDKDEAGFQALASDWSAQTPKRAHDVYAATQPGLGFNTGGPVYAYRGYGVAAQDAYDIEDPLADLSSNWVPPVYGMDDISSQEQAILDQEALAESEYQQRLAQQIAMADNMVAGGDGDDLGTVTPPAPPVADDSEYQQRLAQQIAMAENMVEGGDGDDLGTASTVPAIAEEGEVPWWEGITDWAFGEEGTAVARARNAESDVKITEANAENAAENLMELQERVENGQPVNSHSLEMAKDAVEHTTEQHEEAVAEAAAHGLMLADDAAEEITDDLVESNQPGPEDDRVVLEDLANSEEFENEDDPSKPSEKGQQHPGEVVAEGEKAAKENPEMLDKAKGFFKSAFSDLFDGKELARMALMYVGSRALGYSHAGSINWAAKQYVTRLDAKETAFNDLLKSGKYTPQSLQQYKETGDVSVLRTPGEPANALGNFKTYYKNGKQVRAQEYKIGDTKVWLTPDGKKIDATYTDDASTVKGTPEYGTRIKEDSAQYTGMLKDLRANFGTIPGGRGEADRYATELSPTVAGNKIAKWAVDKNVPPEYMGSIVENAYHAALEHQKNTGDKVRDLTPFLEEQYVAAQVGDTTLFKREDGSSIDGVEVNKMFNAVKAAAANMGQSELSTSQILQGYQKAWNDLDPEVQKQWNRKATDKENGFMKFVLNDVNKSL